MLESLKIIGRVRPLLVIHRFQALLPSGVEFLQGGTVEIDIAAQAETWRETVAFLGAHLTSPSHRE